MSGKVISTKEMEDSLIAGEDKNMEINSKKDKKKVNDDFPVKQIDQSKTVSTRNVVPNKRPLTLRDVTKYVRDNLKVDGTKKDKKKSIVKKENTEKKREKIKKEETSKKED